MAKEKPSDITYELENRFLTYALSTIVSRSLPDVRDGLKPIHRRILFAMHGIGLGADAKPVKSAKIIGEVLGKYHPHGDASTYDSMVRMAQDFSMRYPLVDGKGNFGSIDGDSAAAYRYTEGRLTAITAYMLADIKKDTVDFRQNYDYTLKEPTILPSKVPNLLINGSSGIAVGMACSFPSHNLSEVTAACLALIDDRGLTTAQIMKYIKGPDFPTGAILLNSKTELRKAYEEGSGNLKIRGEWKLEKSARGRVQIIVTSIPYGVNKARLIEKIAEIIIAKKLPGLVDVRDESDEKIRVVLEAKTGQDPEKIMTYIFRHTDLESGFQINFNCLTPKGEPSRLSLKEIITYFLDFRMEVVTRRLKYELDILEKRLHILAGLVIVFKNLDKALQLIRSSKSRQEANGKLKKAFRLDDEQAGAVLEIPLYRLVSMEVNKFIDEHKEKLKEQKWIQGLLKSKKKIWQEIKKELIEIEEKFGDKRRTKIKTIESVEYNAEDFIDHEDVFLVISQKGWLRKFKTLIDPAALKFKENDSLLEITQVNTMDLVAFFTSSGVAYIQKAHTLPYTRSGFGEPIQNLFKFEDGERVIRVLPLVSNISREDAGDTHPTIKQKKLKFMEKSAEPKEILLVSERGYGFRFPLSNLTETSRAGKKVMSVKTDDRMVGVDWVHGSHVFLATESGKGLRLKLGQVTQLSGPGVGVKLMNVAKSRLVAAKCVNPKDTLQLILENGKTKEIKMTAVPTYHRGSQGVGLAKRTKIINAQLIKNHGKL